MNKFFLALIVLGAVMVALGLLLSVEGNQFVKVVLYYTGAVVLGFALVSYYELRVRLLGIIILIEAVVLFVLAFINILGFVSTALYLLSGLHAGAYFVALFRRLSNWAVGV